MSDRADWPAGGGRLPLTERRITGINRTRESTIVARHQESASFEATLDSLSGFACPDWFRDAKFGIWSHWGPQSVPRQGDWYARNMYVEGSEQYRYHLRTYGHPAEFGYKDVVELWKAESFDPDGLMCLQEAYPEQLILGKPGQWWRVRAYCAERTAAARRDNTDTESIEGVEQYLVQAWPDVDNAPAP